MKTQKELLLLLITIFTILFQSINAQSVNADEFLVSGTLKGIDVPYMFIDYTGENGDRVWDTLHIKKNKFSYTSKLTNTKRIAIWPFMARKRKEGDYSKQKRVEFLAKPGEHIIYKGSISKTFDAYPTGTSLSNDLNKYNALLKPVEEESAKILNKMNTYERGSAEYMAVYKELNKVGKKSIEIGKQFIKNNPTSEVSAYILSNLVGIKSIEDKEATILFNALDNKLSASPFYVIVKTRLEGSKATAPGSKVPELITTSTLDGREFNLESLKGKYVLLDFWGTWCGPCIAEMPKVKEYKEKYKDELVIVAVNSGDTKEQIEKFITPKGYNWVQLLSKKRNQETDFVSRFNVNGFPTKFVIDPNGIILHRYVGNAEEAFDKLDELLKK
ncbi:MAG: TlpA family protein disulfide reductase [Cellulophaga sp.]